MLLPNYLNFPITPHDIRFTFVIMAQILHRHDANIMGSPIQLPEYRGFLEFPEYKEPSCKFPEYAEPVEIMADLDVAAHISNKNLEHVIRTPGRQPSPQPAHFNEPSPHRNGNLTPGGNGHRVLRSATVGYIAPAFAGKSEQMAQGRYQFQECVTCTNTQ
jgi:hypothetical protein